MKKRTLIEFAEFAIGCYAKIGKKCKNTGKRCRYEDCPRMRGGLALHHHQRPSMSSSPSRCS